MSESYEYLVVKVGLDHTGALLAEDDGAAGEIGDLRAWFIDSGPPELPIVIYVKQDDAEMKRIETGGARHKQAIAEVIAPHAEDADGIEFRLGEPGEPTFAEVTGGVEAASALGLPVQLRLRR